MKKKNTLLTMILVSFFSIALHSQNEPIIREAELGTLGADYTEENEGGITYVTSMTDLINSGNPGSADKVISFEFIFPDSGTYTLYARLRVGSGNFNDDSYFYANGFGTKDPVVDADWIMANGLASGGFTNADDFVSGNGGAANNVWKWVNFTDFGGGSPITFHVDLGSLNQTFQIGTREDGLDLDKFAFARSDYFYTVSNLDNGEAGSATGPGPVIPVGPPLADGQSKFLGNIYSATQLDYFELFWNQVTPENAGKWASVESTRDVMNWGGLDNAYNLAKDNGFPFKLHVLVWGSQQPTWIAALDSADQFDEIEEWFSGIANQYADIDQIEVVNEPLHQPPDTPERGGYIGALGGDGATGWDWIINAFRLARTHFPNVELLINEYGIISSASTTRQYMEIIKLLQAEDSLINAIGVQAHAFSNNASSNTISNSLDSLATTGLPIYVTELDIDGPSDAIQIRDYQRVFPIFWEHPGVEGITLWGYRPGLWTASANLLRSNGEERPALTWLRAYILDKVVYVESVTVSAAGGATEIDTDKGTLQLMATVLSDTATVKDIVWSISNTKLASIESDGLLQAKANGIVTVTASAIDGSGEKDTWDVAITNQIPSGVEHSGLTRKFAVYPNPSIDGNFTIDGIDNISYIEVLDLSGQQLKEFKVFNQSSVSIHLDMPSGMYFVRLSDGEKLFYEKIIIK